MKRYKTVAVLVILLTLTSPTFTEIRCGWFVDPTPGNAWLIDKKGEWILGLQGGYQAEGQEKWTREFSDSEWVNTNGIHGYGCACMKGNFRESKMEIVEVFKAWPRPLSACRSDRAVRGKEPRY